MVFAMGFVSVLRGVSMVFDCFFVVSGGFFIVFDCFSMGLDVFHCPEMFLTLGCKVILRPFGLTQRPAFFLIFY